VVSQTSGGVVEIGDWWWALEPSGRSALELSGRSAVKGWDYVMYLDVVSNSVG